MKPYWRDDRARIVLWHGDAREIVPKLVDVAVVVTDPPYGIGYESGWASSWSRRRIEGDDDVSVRDEVLALVDAPKLIFSTWKRPVPAGTHTILVWNKGSGSGMGDLTVPWKPSWEQICVVGTGFVGRRDEGVLSGFTGLSRESAGRAHPNEKPSALLRYLLAKCPSGVVLDPFAGSGTTLRAAKDLGRPAIGIEIDERWCEVAVWRLAQEVLPFDVSVRIPRQMDLLSERSS